MSLVSLRALERMARRRAGITEDATRVLAARLEREAAEIVERAAALAASEGSKVIKAGHVARCADGVK